MNRKQKIIVSITGIFIVLLALVGLTYAYFLTRIRGNEKDKSISVTTANLELTYDDGTDGVIRGEKLEPSNEVYTKTFTVTNTGNANVTYGVFLIDVINEFERKDDIKYTMECTTTGTLPCGKVENETTFPSGISELSTASIEPQKVHTYTFKFTYKDSGTNQSVDMNKKLEAKIQIFAPNNKGEYYPYEEDTLAYNIINNSINRKNSTLLVDTPPTKVAEEISSSNLENGTEQNITINMDDITSYASTAEDALNCGDMYQCNNDAVLSAPSSCSDIRNKYVYGYALVGTHYVNGCDGETPYYTISAETTISTTLDNYGTSYYYRGNVEDNYVTFADMCWRIVRINGDGSTKLILEDLDQPCSTSINGNWAISTTTEGSVYNGNFGFTEHSSNTLTASDGQKNSKILKVMDYLHGETDSDKSMATAFKNFQSTFTENELSKLKSGNWCLEDSGYSQTITGSYPNYEYTYTLLNETQKMDNKIKNTYFYNDSYVRLIGNNDGYEPTLKCNGTMMNDWDDNATNPTPMYVGAITADEVVYAGGKAYESNPNYYLINEDFKKGSSGVNKTSYFWLLSPYGFDSMGNRAFSVHYRGDLASSTVVDSSNGFRPSVSLRSGIIATTNPDTETYGMPGSINNPYVIN